MKRSFLSRKSVQIPLIIILFLNVLIVLTGNTYLYKAIRYNFVNIDDYTLFQNRKVEASNTPEPWPRSQEKMSSTARLDSLHTAISSIAFVVIHRDTVVYESYWDGYSDSSYSNSFSMAKSYVSALIGAAIQDGKIISVKQPVGDFLPSFAEGKKASITLEHLLAMSSGLDWDESYSSPLSATTEAYYGTDLKSLVLDQKAIEEPGQSFKYLSANTQLLALVLREATGKTLSEYAAEKIWKPTGAMYPALWSLDEENGLEKAYCCLNSNALDFARFGKLYIQKGMWGNKRLLPASYVEASTKPFGYQEDPIQYYGYQWWLIPDFYQEDVFYARGILGQYIICLPKRNIIIVRLGKERSGTRFREEHPMEVKIMVEEVLTQLDNS